MFGVKILNFDIFGGLQINMFGVRTFLWICFGISSKLNYFRVILVFCVCLRLRLRREFLYQPNRES